MNLTVTQIEIEINEMLTKVINLEKAARETTIIQKRNIYLVLAKGVKSDIAELELLKEKRSA